VANSAYLAGWRWLALVGAGWRWLALVVSALHSGPAGWLAGSPGWLAGWLAGSPGWLAGWLARQARRLAGRQAGIEHAAVQHGGGLGPALAVSVRAGAENDLKF